MVKYSYLGEIGLELESGGWNWNKWVEIGIGLEFLFVRKSINGVESEENTKPIYNIYIVVEEE
jgi:hypothetical protein